MAEDMKEKLVQDQCNLIEGRARFEEARLALINGAKAVQKTTYFGDETMDEIKNVIGDLSITVALIDEVLG